MLFFANGDSHTFGSELPNYKNAYSYLLAKKLNFDTVINLAVGGASNDRILRTTEKFLLSCDINNNYPRFILIGWSEYTRQDWYHNGEYRSLTSNQPEDFITSNSNRFDYSKTIFNEINFINKFTKYFHEKIYNLHLELNYRKIPHLFLNTCKSYAASTDLSELIKYDWQNRFWEPYSTSGGFCEWSKNNGFNKTIWHHIEQAGHDKFTEVLYNYIIEHDLLSCPTDN